MTTELNNLDREDTILLLHIHNFYLIFFSKVRNGRKSSDMSSDFCSRLRGPSGYTTSPLKTGLKFCEMAGRTETQLRRQMDGDDESHSPNDG